MLRKGIQFYYFSIVLLLTSLFVMVGCYKFEGDQTIPAYISIDRINLNTNYPEQGTKSEDIDDVWVYLDDGLIGIFEFDPSDTIPLEFPALAEGKHKLEIRPGIKLNGISSTRVPYPFYKPLIFEEFDFIPGTTQSLGTLTTTYYPDIKFAWMEDFELPNISIESSEDTAINYAVLEQTSPENNPNAFLTANSKYSGLVNLTTENQQFVGLSYNSFEIQPAGTIIILELDFKTNNFMQVGLLIRGSEEWVERDLVILNHNDEWQKIYINLGSNLSLFPTAIDYKVIFKAGIEDGLSESEIFLDNIKIVYR
jgi:hypothetical protein